MNVFFALLLSLFVVGTVIAAPQEDSATSHNEDSSETTVVPENNIGSSILGPDLSKGVQVNLDLLEKVTPIEFPIKIDRIRDDIMKFIDHKTRVCNGDFSPVALDDPATNQNKKIIRLTREERLLCIKELRAIHVHFINNSFEARKRYLNYLHDMRLRELDTARDDVLKGLNSTLSKIR
jgi:hypothetical protein